MVWLKDGITADSLFSYHISGGQAPTRYVTDMKPAEPEMWLALSPKKIAWSYRVELSNTQFLVVTQQQAIR